MQSERGRGLYISLAVELLVLGLTIGALWTTLALLAARRRLPVGEPAVLEGPAVARDVKLGLRMAALGVHVLVTGALALLLLASDDKKQAVLGLVVASFAGTVAASLIGPVPKGAWIWAGPVAVGAVGYLAAAFGGHGGTEATGLLSPLLRAAPLDYAGAGVTGAFIGRWIGVSQDVSTNDRLRRELGLFYYLFRHSKANQAIAEAESGDRG
jgi:hypothetical protein